MGWSESYWEDVRADWARLQSERQRLDEDDIPDGPIAPEIAYDKTVQASPGDDREG